MATLSFSMPDETRDDFVEYWSKRWPEGTPKSQAFREMYAFFKAHHSADSVIVEEAETVATTEVEHAA